MPVLCDRDVDGSFDYSDYSYWYDTIYTTGYYADLHFLSSGDRSVPNQFFNDAGTRIMPGARFVNDDGYEKVSHEIRVSSPRTHRFAFSGCVLSEAEARFPSALVSGRTCPLYVAKSGND